MRPLRWATLGLMAATAVGCQEAERSPTTGTIAATAEPYYASCGDAPGPLHRGDPGYRSGLDRDGDGVACEVDQ